MREWTSSGPNSQLSLAFVAAQWHCALWKTQKQLFKEWRIEKDTVPGERATVKGARAASEKRESQKTKIKKPLSFYAKRLSRESSGQLGQWHDRSYMCLDDFLPKRLWFSCLSSLLQANRATLGSPSHSASTPLASLCLVGCDWACASRGTLRLAKTLPPYCLPIAQHHTKLSIYLFFFYLGCYQTGVDGSRSCSNKLNILIYSQSYFFIVLDCEIKKKKFQFEA